MASSNGPKRHNAKHKATGASASQPQRPKAPRRPSRLELERAARNTRRENLERSLVAGAAVGTQVAAGTYVTTKEAVAARKTRKKEQRMLNRNVPKIDLMSQGGRLPGSFGTGRRR